MKKIELRSLIGEHNTHYLKWNISDDLSIRYFYMFNDKRAMEGKFFIKSHKNKEYSEISKEIVSIMIYDLKLKKQEIVGTIHNKKFEKLNITEVFDSNSITTGIKKALISGVSTKRILPSATPGKNRYKESYDEFKRWCYEFLPNSRPNESYVINELSIDVLGDIGFYYDTDKLKLNESYTMHYLFNNYINKPKKKRIEKNNYKKVKFKKFKKWALVTLKDINTNKTLVKLNDKNINILDDNGYKLKQDIFTNIKICTFNFLYNNIIKTVAKKEWNINTLSTWCHNNLEIFEKESSSATIGYIIDDNALKLLDAIGFTYHDNLFTGTNYSVKYLWDKSL